MDDYFVGGIHGTFVVFIAFVVLVLYCIAMAKLYNSQPSRRGVLTFSIVAGALALIRVGALWFLYYRFHSNTETTPVLGYILLPENGIIYMLGTQNPELHAVLLTILLAIGSFLWVTPLLLIGAKRKTASDPMQSKTL